MKIVVSWLRELCPTPASVEEIAAGLTRQGVKVEAILRPWERLSGVVAARVVEVRDHPSSDKLCLTRVTTGAGEREVVAGVRNMRPGDLVPLAGPGATIPALEEPLSARTIRGVVSDGMLCSPRELGVSPDHGGILILPAETPLGADVRATFGLDDAVLDIEVKSNRPDLLSVLGVAREVAAATGVPSEALDEAPGEAAEKAVDVATVEIRDVERCPRYLARVVRGVSVGPSPLTVQARLTASGMRPVSNVVDATNYVMLELGQPMHPFDLALLAGPGIVVRRAEAGEHLLTLDDLDRELSTEDLLIADLEKPVAIAGVMGSASAEVSARTTDVLLESAHFAPKGVLRTSRGLGLVTEASTRFARGTDPEAVDVAAARAASLIARWAGGSVLAGAVDVGRPSRRGTVSLRPPRASALLGYDVSAQDAAAALERLGLAVEHRDDALQVTVPPHRWDLEQEVDLIEEVARIQGYERVPETFRGARQPGGVGPAWTLRRRVQHALVRNGLREAVSFSFVSAADLALVGHGEDDAVSVANPLAADDAFLRTSLLPGLLRAARRNAARGVAGVALFEVGRVFARGASNEPVSEREFVAVAVAGSAGEAVHEERRLYDFFDAKGALEALFSHLGVGEWSLGGPAGGFLHPARSAEVIVGDTRAGLVGELHPRVAEQLDLPPRTAVLELDLSGLARHTGAHIVYRELPRYPPVHRDLAFIVASDVPAGAVRDALADALGEHASSVSLFDVFSGPPVPEGRKSLAFSVDMRAPDRTLTDQEVDREVEAAVERLRAAFGAELRAG